MYTEKEEETEIKQLTVLLTGGVNFSFMGKYRRDLENGAWHYYETKTGNIHHFRKDHMLAVLEGDLEKPEPKMAA